MWQIVGPSEEAYVHANLRFQSRLFQRHENIYYGFTPIEYCSCRCFLDCNGFCSARCAVFTPLRSPLNASAPVLLYTYCPFPPAMLIIQLFIFVFFLLCSVKYHSNKSVVRDAAPHHRCCTGSRRYSGRKCTEPYYVLYSGTLHHQLWLRALVSWHYFDHLLQLCHYDQHH